MGYNYLLCININCNERHLESTFWVDCKIEKLLNEHGSMNYFCENHYHLMEYIYIYSIFKI